MFRLTTLASVFLGIVGGLVAAPRPNVVLVMADDQGWGQTGYYQHPVLRTPHLDAMAAAGLRFDRFYSGAATCSPTRATVLTGRSNDRCGVQDHGFALRRQEKTLAAALRQAGYATGHFGKWHLNGLRGPGVPILPTDDHNPGAFGFDEWISVSNFFDRDPLMSRNGRFEAFQGDSSEIIVAEALKFMAREAAAGRPFLAVVWYGSPHGPWGASETDRSSFSSLSPREQNHYGELVALDRSIGRLRAGLRESELAENTLVWFCSDNGGLRQFGPATVGGLRGGKGTIYEGGLRVPCVIEWPAGIPKPRITRFPAATLDVFPTVAELVGLPRSTQLEPQDGMSLVSLFKGETGPRTKPIPFRQRGRAAWIDNEFKLLTEDLESGRFQLYNLEVDPAESHDLTGEQPERAERMREALLSWNQSVEASVAGHDYPEGRVDPSEPSPRNWRDVADYTPFFPDWVRRPEYRSEIQNAASSSPAE